eukprot:2703825-Rhodomonas_salina.1
MKAILSMYIFVNTLLSKAKPRLSRQRCTGSPTSALRELKLCPCHCDPLLLLVLGSPRASLPPFLSPLSGFIQPESGSSNIVFENLASMPEHGRYAAILHQTKPRPSTRRHCGKEGGKKEGGGWEWVGREAGRQRRETRRKKQ